MFLQSELVWAVPGALLFSPNPISFFSGRSALDFQCDPLQSQKMNSIYTNRKQCSAVTQKEQYEKERMKCYYPFRTFHPQTR